MRKNLNTSILNNRGIGRFIFLSSVVFALSTPVWAQSEKVGNLKGQIVDQHKNAVPYAPIYDDKGKAVDHADEDGYFNLKNYKNKYFVINSMGYNNDTIQVATWKNNDIIQLTPNQVLTEVTIIGKERGSEFDRMSTVQKTNISSRELLKAACCNLSESFETTPSVDVGFSDGVSGYKTIQLLGLSGPNTLYTRESIADLRGLGSVVGLTFTPGAWVESIQLSKGAGSVLNGFEGTAGQINVEWPKAFIHEEPRLFINGYQNTHGRSELNVIYNQEINHDLSTSILAHYANNWLETDENKDGFRDNPLGQNLILSNRWIYMGNDGWEFQAGAKGVKMDMEGGSMQGKEVSQPWIYRNDIERIESWAKVGKVYEHTPWKSMGLQLSHTYHNQESQWHQNKYTGKQNSFTANYLYQTIISNTFHKITMGSQFLMDQFNESWKGQQFNPLNKMYIGAYGEYSYNPSDAFNIVLGLRGDYDTHAKNVFITPRMHIRTDLWKDAVGRVSVGRAKRTVHPFTEFAGYLASNREIRMDLDGNEMNDWKMEDAWNMGASITQDLIIANKEGQISFDAYYTYYNSQIIADIQTPGYLDIYQMDPGSRVFSTQIEASYEPINRLEVKASYRYQHINIPYKNGWQNAFLHAPHKAFVNIGYSTRNNWSFDATAHILGEQKVPYHPGLPSEILANQTGPMQFFLNGQIAKSWKNNKYDWYIGIENATGQMQKTTILNNANLSDPLLDAGIIYGSPMGRLIYTGFRIRI